MTSDSDFSYLCRKLHERGATVYIVGKHKTPDSLRNASDQFLEWVRPETPAEPITSGGQGGHTSEARTAEAGSQAQATQHHRGGHTARGRCARRQGQPGRTGQLAAQGHPAFSPKTNGHSGLLDMVKTYDLLVGRQEEGGSWTVGLGAKGGVALPER